MDSTASKNRLAEAEARLDASAAPSGSAESAASDSRLALALHAGQLGYWELDLRTKALFASDVYKANWGHPAGAPLSYAALLAQIHPDDRQMHEDAVAKAGAGGETLDIDYRVTWPDGSLHWLRVRGHAIADRGAQPLRMAGISLDITDSKVTEESLREESRRLETLHRIGVALAGNLDLERIVQTVTDAATELSGAQFGAFFYNVIDAKGESYTLYTISGVPREMFTKFPMPRNTAVFDPTFRGEGVIRSDDIRKDPRYGQNDPHFGMPKGHLPVVSYLAAPVTSRSGEVLGGLFFGHERAGVFSERTERLVVGIAAQAAIAIDNARLFRAAETEIAERRRVEHHQELLLAELNHRVKNTLAIVLSIATQTLRHADSAEAFRAGFETRIMALAEAHNLLTDRNWEGASLRDILDRVLGPYRGDRRTGYRLGGQDLQVSPQTAVALVMAFNELATNAAKYGALSNATGQIEVDWTVMAGNGMDRLEIFWRETGGPRVAKPTRTGFGTRLIRGLSQDASGQVDMTYAQEGLMCTFNLPLTTGGQG